MSSDVLRSIEDCTDVITWINKSLLPLCDRDRVDRDVDSAATRRQDLTQLDQCVTQLVSLLDIACQDTSVQLEHIVDDASRGVPRLTYDLQVTKDDVSSLQTVLTTVQETARDSMPREMSLALDHLQYLDTIRGGMEAAREVLREAESWSTLELEVTSLLAEHSYEKAAERLSEASRSMVIFENTPEYESRRALMVSLQNQLEASLSSALVAAIKTRDVAVCRHYFSIFANIQRESEFRNYYNGSRRASIMEIWQNVHLLDCDSTSSSTGLPQKLSSFLSTFYNHFLLILGQERASVTSIFPDPQITLSTFISSTLSSLQPTFSQRLASLLNYYGVSALEELIAALRATEEFALATQKILEKMQHSDIPPANENVESSQAQKGVSRRRSARTSISWRSGSHRSSNGPAALKTLSSLDLDWDQDLFQPFLHLQVDYSSLETRLLSNTVRDIASAEQNATVSGLNKARLLRETSVDVFSAAEDSLDRCNAFTHGYGAIGLLKALNHMLQSFLSAWTADIAAGHIYSSTVASVAEPGGNLSDLDYSSSDWDKIQSTLHILASARAFFDRMTVFEGKLRSYLVQVAVTFRLARAENSSASFVGVTRGEAQLLAQSALNSMDLHDLLRVADSEITSQVREPFTPSPAVPGLRHDHVFLLARSSSSPLIDAHTALSAFARACQVSLQDTILSPLRNRLAPYPSLPVWTAPDDLKSKHTGAVSDLHIPVFSLSPTDVVQRVAEGLLNLPRLFEADDDALSFSLDTLPHIDVDSLKALSEQPPPGSDSPHSHIRRGSISSKGAAFTPEAISAAWLFSLGHSVLHHLTNEILPNICILTTSGAAQLSSDLGYLSNVVRALNVENEEVEQWRELAGMDDEEGSRRATEKEVDPIFQVIAKMRGWNRASV